MRREPPGHPSPSMSGTRCVSWVSTLSRSGVTRKSTSNASVVGRFSAEQCLCGAARDVATAVEEEEHRPGRGRTRGGRRPHVQIETVLVPLELRGDLPVELRALRGELFRREDVIPALGLLRWPEPELPDGGTRVGHAEKGPPAALRCPPHRTARGGDHTRLRRRARRALRRRHVLASPGVLLRLRVFGSGSVLLRDRTVRARRHVRRLVHVLRPGRAVVGRGAAASDQQHRHQQSRTPHRKRSFSAVPLLDRCSWHRRDLQLPGGMEGPKPSTGAAHTGSGSWSPSPQMACAWPASVQRNARSGR